MTNKNITSNLPDSVSLEDLRDFASKFPDKLFTMASSTLWLAAQYAKVKFNLPLSSANYHSISLVSSTSKPSTSCQLPPEYSTWAVTTGRVNSQFKGKELTIIIEDLIAKRDSNLDTRTEIEKSYDNHQSHL